MSNDRQQQDRQRLRAYIAREQLGSVMNDTKWERLLDALEPLYGFLEFRRKDVRESRTEASSRWNGDMYEVFGRWENIEWLEIRADRCARYEGALPPTLPPIKAEDHTDDMLEALRAAGVPYERTEEGVRIWGYLRPGTSPNWDHAT
jgi:hypothetical protein